MSDFGFVPITAVGAGVAGLAIAALTFFYVKAQPAGNDTMRDLADAIHEGSMTFLRWEYAYLVPFLAVVAVLLGLALGWNTAYGTSAMSGT